MSMPPGGHPGDPRERPDGGEDVARPAEPVVGAPSGGLPVEGPSPEVTAQHTADTAGQPPTPDQFAQPDVPGQPIAPGQSGPPSQPGGPGRPGAPGQVGAPGQQGVPGRFGSASQDGRAGAPGQEFGAAGPSVGEPRQLAGPGVPGAFGGVPGQPAAGAFGGPSGGVSGPQAGGYGPPGAEAYGMPPGGAFGAPGAGQYGAPGWPVPGSGKRKRAPLVITAVAVAVIAVSAIAWVANRGGGDPKGQADKFMSAVQGEDFNTAKGLLCKDGRDQFSGIDEMREKLAGGPINGYSIGGVSDDTYQGDKRKEVAVSVQLSDGTSDTVTLSMTKESGKYLVCGF
jgi:hypothetical protein